MKFVVFLLTGGGGKSCGVVVTPVQVLQDTTPYLHIHLLISKPQVEAYGELWHNHLYSLSKSSWRRKTT